VSEEELKSHHLLLLGRLNTNRLVQKWQNALPITFARGSFAVREEIYAHPDSSVIVAAENPKNKRFSIVVLAGLGAASTLRTAPKLASDTSRAAELLVLPHGAGGHYLVLPAKDLVCEVNTAATRKTEARRR
jgi:hypothetical protein